MSVATMKVGGQEEREQRSGLSALLRGILEGLGGPALLGVSHRYPVSVTISADEQLRERHGKDLARAMREIMIAMDHSVAPVLVENGLVAYEALDRRLDKHGKLREVRSLRVRRADVERAKQSS